MDFTKKHLAITIWSWLMRISKELSILLWQVGGFALISIYVRKYLYEIDPVVEQVLWDYGTNILVGAVVITMLWMILNISQWVYDKRNPVLR